MYFRDPRLSYSENVLLTSVDNVKYSVNSSTQQLIATKEQLQDLHVAVEQNTRAVEEMSEDICLELRSVSSQIDTTNKILYWGLSNIVDSLKDMERTLQGVLTAVEDTDKAWAYAQYRHCLENYRKGLQKEAIERISYAINGLGEAHLGYKEDYRFHFLLGSLYLGRNIPKPDKDLFDPKKAEDAFIASARYAEHDAQHEAAYAYLNAGLSALAQGNTERALVHVESSISLNKSLAEAYFQQSKILCRLGKVKLAFDGPLQKAIAYHPMYAEKAAGDEDIKKHKRELDAVIIEQKEHFKHAAGSFDAELKKEVEHFDEVRAKLKVLSIADIEPIKSESKDAEQHLATNTLVGAWQGKEAFVVLRKKYRDLVRAHVNKALENTVSVEMSQHRAVDEKEESHMRMRNAPKDVLKAIIFGLLVTGCAISFSDQYHGSSMGLVITIISVVMVVFFTIKGTLANLKEWSPREKIRNNSLLGLIIIGFMILLWPKQSAVSVVSAPALGVLLYGISGIIGSIPGSIIKIFIPKGKQKFQREKKRYSSIINEDKETLTKLKENLS